MAKRTKRTTARRAKAPKKASAKVARKAKKPKKQAAKRPPKTKAKQQRAKSGRPGEKSGAKKLASRRRRRPTQRKAPQPEPMIAEPPQAETSIVDVIEEPVPGVFVVAEFVETSAKPESADSLNIDQTVGPESEEQ